MTSERGGARQMAKRMAESLRYAKALDQGPRISEPAADWGTFTRFLEVGPDGYAVRHVDAFHSGRFLRYDRGHWIDGFGQLADARMRVLRPSQRWRGERITAAEFEAAWEAAGSSAEWVKQLAASETKLRGWPVLNRGKRSRVTEPEDMTSRQVIRRLVDEGWHEVRQTGNHKQFQHDSKLGTVTVPTHKGDIPAGTLASIYRQAGWEKS